MLNAFFQLSCLILLGALIWFLLLVRWVIKNPDYANAVKSKEAPYPWFFRVWLYFYYCGRVAIAYLLFYAIRFVVLKIF